MSVKKTPTNRFIDIYPEDSLESSGQITFTREVDGITDRSTEGDKVSKIT